MNPSEIIFENLDQIEASVQRLRDELGYITLSEVKSRLRADTVGRVDFTAVSLASFLIDDDADGVPTFPDMDAITDEDLARAVGRWLRQHVHDNLIGRSEAKFKVSLWSPKGDTHLCSGRFIARRAERPMDSPAGTFASGLPSPFPANGVLPPDAAVWQALGGSYVNFVTMMQSGYAHLFGLQNSAIVVLNGDNQRLRKTLESAYGDLAKLRIGTFEAETEQRRDQASAKVREELSRQFISELGSLGRVIASAKLGLPAELAELIELVNATPELAEAIRDPEVRKVLRDEKTRKELAALLKIAAATPAKA